VATAAASLLVKVTSDTAGAVRGMEDVAGGASRFQSGIAKAGRYATVAAAGLAIFGKEAFDSASQAEQAGGAVDAVYGKTASTIHRFAKTSATDVGLASSEYEQMAAIFGAQLKNMGVESKKLAPTTDELITLGADLAAQYGGPTSDAVEALGSLLRGERDPIERYGVSIKEADVQAKKAEMGLAGLTGAADKQATTQATLALLTEQTADATGAFAREANTAAGQQQRANAQYKNATAAIGQALLPVVSKLAEWFAKLGQFAQDNAGAIQAFGFAAAALATILIGASVATKAWAAAQLAVKVATAAWTAAQWLLNAALTANPIGIVVVAIGGLIAAVVLLVKNWDKVTAALKATWNWLKQNWDKLIVIVLGPFGLVIAWIIKNWRKIWNVFKATGRIFAAVFNTVRNIAKAVFGAIAAVVRVAIAVVRKYIAIVRTVLTAAFKVYRAVALAVFAVVRAAIDRTIGAIGRIISWVRERFVAAWRTLRDVVANIFGAIRDIVARTIDPIQRVIAWLRERLTAAFRTVRDVAKAALDAIRAPIQTLLESLGILANFVQVTLSGAWNTMKGVAVAAFNAILGPIQAAIDAVRSLIDWIGNIKLPSFGGILDKLNPFSAPAPAPAVARVGYARYAAPGVGRAAGAGAVGAVGIRGAQAPIQITVNGALDPDAVARQIQRILKQRGRRVGGVGTLATTGVW
jgi:hypothetical protein